MTITCKLCKTLIMPPELQAAGPADIPVLGQEPMRRMLEYQATVLAFMQHLGQYHGQYIATLAHTANTYHLHLCAKLADSSDPDFEQQAEIARRLCYWTLRGDFKIDPESAPQTNGKSKLHV